MEIVLNATLSGGVAIGGSADLCCHPAIPIFIGMITGVISAVGFAKLNAFCLEKINLHDTCGVQFLHGIPGVIGGLTAAFHFVNLQKDYGETNFNLLMVQLGAPGRSQSSQFGSQLGAIVCTLVIAIVSGLITGFILNLSIFSPLDPKKLFLDDDHF